MSNAPQTFLRFPSHPDAIQMVICKDMELYFVSQLESRLNFMRMRGMTDPYDLAQERQNWITEHLDNQQKLLDLCLEVVPAYLADHQCPDDEFQQAWALMGGIWNAVTFEQILPIVRIQRKYPVLLQVAKIMGRQADEEGSERIAVSMGGDQKMTHAAPSDIEGVGVGNDISALLPLELAQMTDPDLDGLFAYKYATRRLQTFAYKSNQLQPVHKLRIQRARQKGPMIVCLDTSASMTGVPTQIAHSLIVKLLQLALAQDRELLLVAFSVTAKTLDVRKERTRLLQLFRQPAEGATDARDMLQKSLQTLIDNPAYRSADVLLISDFQIPLETGEKRDPQLLQQLRTMEEMRDYGTKFFGLQIGEPGPHLEAWRSHFDRIWNLPYKTRMRPWFIQK